MYVFTQWHHYIAFLLLYCPISDGKIGHTGGHGLFVVFVQMRTLHVRDIQQSFLV